MSSSEDKLPNLEKEYPEKNEELINSMWATFSVEDYIQCGNADFPAAEKKQRI